MTLSRLLVVLGIVLTITAALHYFIWARLVKVSMLPLPYARALTWAILGLAILLPACMILSRYLPRGVASPFVWVGFTWLGLVFFLFILLLPAELVRLGLKVVTSPSDPERRLFFQRAIAAAVSLGAVSMAGASLAEGLESVKIKKLKIPMPKLPRGLDGYTIVQLTDVHVGPTIGGEFIRELVDKTNALNPDLIAITGDLVDGSVKNLGPFVEPLSRLKARDGVFFVTGNHEYYSGVQEWLAFLETLGIRVLRNEHVALREGSDGEGLDLVGVDDATSAQFGHGHGMNVPAALAGRDPRRLAVLLAHQPVAIHEASKGGVDLQLSGHTHAGQLFPFNYLVKLVQPYVAGLHRHEDTMIYVSPGTGYWGPPMRLGAPAEITHIELTKGPLPSREA